MLLRMTWGAGYRSNIQLPSRTVCCNLNLKVCQCPVWLTPPPPPANQEHGTYNLQSSVYTSALRNHRLAQKSSVRWVGAHSATPLPHFHQHFVKNIKLADRTDAYCPRCWQFGYGMKRFTTTEHWISAPTQPWHALRWWGGEMVRWWGGEVSGHRASVTSMEAAAVL